MEITIPKNQEYYYDLFKDLSNPSLLYTISDVKEVLNIWRDIPKNDYTDKIWNQFDALCQIRRERKI